MEKKLDLNDLQIDGLEVEKTQDPLSEHSDGHGLTEIGASCNTNNSTGQGSCKLK
jgi:hypothetical protein